MSCSPSSSASVRISLLKEAKIFLKQASAHPATALFRQLRRITQAPATGTILLREIALEVAELSLLALTPAQESVLFKRAQAPEPNKLRWWIVFEPDHLWQKMC